MPSAQMIADMQQRVEELEQRLAAKSLELILGIPTAGEWSLTVDLANGRFRLTRVSSKVEGS